MRVGECESWKTQKMPFHHRRRSDVTTSERVLATHEVYQLECRRARLNSRNSRSEKTSEKIELHQSGEGYLRRNPVFGVFSQSFIGIRVSRYGADVLE